MKPKLYSDKKKRNGFFVVEKFVLVLKVLLLDRKLSYRFRYFVSELLSFFCKKASFVKIRNRCHITLRSRSVDKFTKLSRIVFRELCSSGQLPGIIKKSWIFFLLIMLLKLNKKVVISVSQNECVVSGVFGAESFTLCKFGMSYFQKNTFEALLQNACVGVSRGFTKHLQLFGVGYRVFFENKSLCFAIGFSHIFKIEVPSFFKIVIDVKEQDFYIFSTSAVDLGNFVNKLLRLKKTNKYKGTGIKLFSLNSTTKQLRK